jgi:hypothetical protein
LFGYRFHKDTALCFVQPGHRPENVQLLISFEKALFTIFKNNFITTLLGIFPHEIEKTVEITLPFKRLIEHQMIISA